MPNLRDKTIDIENNLEEFPNILQQKKKTFKIGDDTVLQPGHDHLSFK